MYSGPSDGQEHLHVNVRDEQDVPDFWHFCEPLRGSSCPRRSGCCIASLPGSFDVSACSPPKGEKRPATYIGHVGMLSNYL